MADVTDELNSMTPAMYHILNLAVHCGTFILQFGTAKSAVTRTSDDYIE